MKFIGIYAVVICAIFFVIAMREGMFSLQTDKAQTTKTIPKNFKECVAAGMPIQESYPRQCRVSETVVFTENIGNELEKSNLIVAESPRPNAIVGNTIKLNGQARGPWYFEASFPVTVVDMQRNVLTSAIAQAQGDWMTENFVPFSSTVTIPSSFSGEAILILHKDNPSGDPTRDDQLEIPIFVSSDNN